MNFRKLPGNRPFYLDGGMGTMLQAMGLTGGEAPERWNCAHPDRVRRVHAAYLEAGCDIVTANTFGATREHLGDEAVVCLRAGVRIAREAVRAAGRGCVALDIGSLGRLLEPLGDMPVEEAIDQFREAARAGIEAGADLILIETMTDLMEAKAAMLGAREAMAQSGARLPLLCSMTFDLRGRLLTGADIPGTAAMLCALGADAVGLNCGHEPAALMDNVRALLACCERPVFVSPNASLPRVAGGETVFDVTPEAFARDMAAIARLGARGLGGCCGTTPAHITAMTAATRDIAPKAPAIQTRLVLSGRSQTATVGERPLMIGERLNPTGKPRMKQALREGDMDYLLREAVAQTEAGADLLDVNVGLPGVDERALLVSAVQAVQSVSALPLALDSADPAALEGALRVYAGRPLINSVCGKRAVMDAVFPLAARYGGALIALTLDENGIPDTAAQRLAIARRILAEGARYGLSRACFLFDALTMAVSADAQAARVTLETQRLLREELGVHTVLGVSNVSFGLPRRPLLTAAFTAQAVAQGLSAAILNPLDGEAAGAFCASAALAARDAGFAVYLARYGAQPGAAEKPQETQTHSVQAAVASGLAAQAEESARALLDGGLAPLELIEKHVMPALERVGAAYEQGTLYLPQLLRCAQAAQAVCEAARARMPVQKGDDSRRVVLATVRGDVHDIGKNIVKVMLQSYGFLVIDLGRDVPPERVLAAVRESGARVAGLSALMTTTVPAMRETIALLRREAPGVRVIVGGAVLTQEYAGEIGADGYARDAMATVRLAESIYACGMKTDQPG